jgi:hypothetical protein
VPIQGVRVANGKSTSWFTEAVIVDIDGEPQGRDDTWFRVVHPIITDEKIEYVIEGSRDKKIGGVSHVSINRLTGEAVDWFIADQGGTSYQCHLENEKSDWHYIVPEEYGSLCSRYYS